MNSMLGFTAVAMMGRRMGLPPSGSASEGGMLEGTWPRVRSPRNKKQQCQVVLPM